jgi:hypothetical protein
VVAGGLVVVVEGDGAVVVEVVGGATVVPGALVEVVVVVGSGLMVLAVVVGAGNVVLLEIGSDSPWAPTEEVTPTARSGEGVSDTLLRTLPTAALATRIDRAVMRTQAATAAMRRGIGPSCPSGGVVG